jgi:uncharacterized protein YjbJ (UPF0337 family)
LLPPQKCACVFGGLRPQSPAPPARCSSGGAKRALGRLTGNRRLEAEGRSDQAKGDLKQAGTKIKDAFRH